MLCVPPVHLFAQTKVLTSVLVLEEGVDSEVRMGMTYEFLVVSSGSTHNTFLTACETQIGLALW